MSSIFVEKLQANRKSIHKLYDCCDYEFQFGAKNACKYNLEQ